MRRYLILALALLVAGCATRPQQVPTQQPAPQPEPAQQNSLLGLSPQEMVSRYGTPALQIREGSSLKLQFRSRRCVMDAYFYPSGSSGSLKSTHIDTRLPSGGDITQAGCLPSLRDSS